MTSQAKISPPAGESPLAALGHVSWKCVQSFDCGAVPPLPPLTLSRSRCKWERHAVMFNGCTGRTDR